MSKKIRCAVCNNLFEPCEKCLKLSPVYGEINQWKRVVCCPEHFMYHMPIIQYVRGKISKDEAKKDLQMVIDKYGMIDFNDNVKGIVDEILCDDDVETIDAVNESIDITDDVQEWSDYSVETTTSKKKRKVKDYK